MKSKILVLVTVALSLLLAIGISTFAVSAEEAEPSVTIAKFNLAFEDNTYLKYAVRFDGVADSAITENNIGMLYWTDYEGGFVPGTENFSSKTTGYTDISGVKHYVFEYTRIAAMNLTDYIYSVAYVELDGETYYSAPVKYSALEYAYNRLGKTNAGTTNTELKTLLNNMLAYGASAQQYFDYKEDRLATADFYQLTLVGGTLADGFTSELVLPTDKVTITAPEIDGKTFAGWQSANGEVVYAENPVVVDNITANTTLFATYAEITNYSVGLKYALNSDKKSYSVTGRGTCLDEKIVIPDVYNGLPVTSIGARAFIQDSRIKCLVTGDNVISIGDYAFSRCTSLEIATYGDGLVKVGEYSFEGCSSLTNVFAGKNFKEISLSAYYFCFAMSNIVVDEENPYYSSIEGSLYDKSGTVLIRYAVGKNDTRFTVPDTVARINEQAFYGASYLTSITIPYSVSSIGEYAFYDCRSLIEVCNESTMNIVIGSEDYGCVGYYAKRIITDESQSAIKVEGNYVFFDDGTDVYFLKYIGNKKDIILPKYDGGKEYEIWQYAFWNNWLDGKITNITIPDGVTSIGEHAFSCCKSLINITIPNSVTNIGNYAFFYCQSLVSVEIPDGLTLIGERVFSGCNSLTSIEIPDSVTSIGKSAFYDCKLITSITIPDSVTSIGDWAFNACTSLTTITIPDSVENIGYSAFVACPSLQFNKYDNAFYLGNENNPYLVLVKPVSQSITSCEISNTTKFIYTYTYFSSEDGGYQYTVSESAFLGCTNLAEIIIPDSVKSIGAVTFANCYSLKSIHFEGTVEQWNAISIDSHWNPNTGSYTIYCTDGQIEKDGTITYS